MTIRALRAERAWPAVGVTESLPVAVLAVAALVLFREPMVTLARDWWTDPDAGHGLLLAPLALFLAWRTGLRQPARPARAAGLALLCTAVLLRYVSGLAVELFTMRVSLLLAGIALVLYFRGVRQVLAWWLPLALLALSIPLPAVITGTLALPLQFKASRLGADLLAWRHVPVALSGNIIALPGRSIFVTEACSGLRSLTALLALGVLIGGIWLRSPWLRGALVVLALPVAVLLNGIRVFLTAFLTFAVDPALGEGFMHASEGLAIFIAAFGVLGAIAWLLAQIEQRWRRA